MAEFSLDSVNDFLNSNNVPEILLIVMGIVALAVAVYYKKDDDSLLYKVLVGVGVAAGVFMVYVAMAAETGWSKGTLLILTVACFTLIVRPIRDINIAVIIGLIFAVWVYLILPDLVADVPELLSFLEKLGSGTPRLIVAIVAGALLYGVLQFIQAIVQLFGKILNAWPFLCVIGVWCIVEAIFLLMGYASTYDYIREAIASK